VLSMRGALWRLDALTGGTPTRLAFVGQDGLSPAIATVGDGRQRLVYRRHVSDTNVWHLAMPSPGAPASAPVKAIASTRADFTPGLSPDGRRVSFASDRSGEGQIWVADIDGGQAIQLTSLTLGGLPGFPRWSHDGRLIAFHGDPRGRPDVIVVPASGGAARVATEPLANGGFPSFSRDGRWLYFALLESAGIRVWRMPAAGGPAIRMTDAEATVSVESPNGDALYYVSAADRPSALWRLPLAGDLPSGVPIKVLDGVLAGSFDVVEDGIYYFERVPGPPNGSASSPAGRIRLQYYPFATGRVTTVADDLGMVGSGLSASRDGRNVYFARVDSTIDELMVVDEFR
jgi:dipeptidyl aminopeptidase/acylaminoacyl peptidase